MNAKLIQRASVLLASLGVTMASAQVASAWTSLAPLADNLNAIVQALNAEPSLKDSKITVQPDGDNVLLTGVTPTQDTSRKATEIAQAAAGGTVVVNALQPEHTTYQMPNYDLAKTLEATKG
jgi:hypothetical protein